MKIFLCMMAAGAATLAAVTSYHGSSPRPEHDDHSVTIAAPEIDPNTLTGPLVLLATGTLIITDRWNRGGNSVPR